MVGVTVEQRMSFDVGFGSHLVQPTCDLLGHVCIRTVEVPVNRRGPEPSISIQGEIASTHRSGVCPP